MVNFRQESLIGLVAKMLDIDCSQLLDVVVLVKMYSALIILMVLDTAVSEVLPLDFQLAKLLLDGAEDCANQLRFTTTLKVVDMARNDGA